MIRSVVIIGSGNLAEALAKAVARSPLELRQLWARNAQRGPAVAEAAGTVWSADPQCLAEADLYLLAVSDAAVAEVAEALPIPPSAIVAHTGGGVPIGALSAARYPRRAVFYPLQTFTRGREVDFSEIPLFLEVSQPDVLPELEAFARTLSRRVHLADSALRVRLHTAAVFACNFVNHMYALGDHLMRQSGLRYEYLKPLIAETAAKALAADHPAAVQTGPAVRGDRATAQRHLEVLAGDPALQEIYNLLSKSIWETSKKT